MPSNSPRTAGLHFLRRKVGAFLATPAGSAIARKPATLAYGLEEQPPAAVTWVSAVQHVGVCAIFMIYPLIIAHQAGLSTDQITNVLQLGFLVLAVASLLQALPRGPVGSRLLAPAIFTGVYLAPSLLAVKAGGLPLVWGMTVFAGLVEMALSRAWSHLRPFVPPESAGLVVFLVGAIIGLAALRVLLEDNPSGALAAPEGIVACCALIAMVALNIWNKGRLKLFCVMIGMAVGYAASDAVGLLSLHDLGVALHRPFLAVPTVAHISWRFRWSLVVPFAVSGLAAAMNSTAVITTYQRLTDAEWVRPDMVSIGRGVLGDGIATTVAGVLGTYGVTISSANVGIVAATGVASRAIGFVMAALLAIAAFQAALISVLAIMPRPVMAAAMLFTAVFIMMGGMQIISTRVLDGRRTLVIGMGMLVFLVVSVYPEVFAAAPHWAQPLVSTPLVLATLVALSLNLLFRIGIRRTVTMAIDPAAPDAKAVSDFIERSAGVWGARRDVTDRVEFAVQQTIDAILGSDEARGPIDLGISYDEFVIDVLVAYHGTPLEFPPLPPSREEILETEYGHRRLAGFLVRRHADRLTATRRDGQTVLRFHFDH